VINKSKEEKMKKFVVLFGMSVVTLFIGAISFSIIKAIKWANHFGMSYFEFSYKLKIALNLLEIGEAIEVIKAKTGIDFNYLELKNYFIDKKKKGSGNDEFRIYKKGEG
jgi:hypothetical protein